MGHFLKVVTSVLFYFWITESRVYHRYSVCHDTQFRFSVQKHSCNNTSTCSKQSKTGHICHRITQLPALQQPGQPKQLKSTDSMHHLPPSLANYHLKKKRSVVTFSEHKFEADIQLLNYLGFHSRPLFTQYTHLSRAAQTVITYLQGIASEVERPDTE